MQPMYPVCFVALGPGDPDLITLKSLRKLRESDTIFCPATISREGVERSRAREIVLELGVLAERIRTFVVPMSKDRSAALATYAALASEACALQVEGQRVAITAEGDAGFYSTTQYISELISRADCPVERTAGIPAFIAAATLTDLHIARGEEQLHIVPGVIAAGELEAKIEGGRSVVIMKCSQSAEAIRSVVRSHPQYGWHYYESVGCADQYYTTDPEDICARPIPYFSIIIVRRERN